jgi:hypothetical protein
MHCIEQTQQNHCLSGATEIADVGYIRPDLSESQAWEALKLAQARSGPGAGITFEAIDRAAHFLYGWPPLAAEAQGGSHAR